MMDEDIKTEYGNGGDKHSCVNESSLKTKGYSMFMFLFTVSQVFFVQLDRHFAARKCNKGFRDEEFHEPRIFENEWIDKARACVRVGRGFRCLM